MAMELNVVCLTRCFGHSVTALFVSDVTHGNLGKVVHSFASVFYTKV